MPNCAIHPPATLPCSVCAYTARTGRTPIFVFLENEPFFINQSRWKAYQDCDRLYGWQYIEQLEPSRKKVYFEFGTAIHNAQVHAQLHGGTADAFEEAAKLAEQSFRTGMSGPQLPGDVELIQNSVDVIRRMLPAYHKHWGDKGQMWKPLGMELAFCVEVGEDSGIFLVGRIDNLVTFMNGLWLVDYKTMAKLDLRDFLKYEIDIQLTAYIYGGTKQLSLDAKARGEKPVIIRGAIIDGLIKTQVPQFHRALFTRTIDELRAFELEFVEKAREIAVKHQRVKNGEFWKVVFPMNTNQCFRYGTCAFRDLCVKDNEVRRLSFRRRSPDYVDNRASLTGTLNALAARGADLTGEQTAGPAGDTESGGAVDQ